MRFILSFLALGCLMTSNALAQQKELFSDEFSTQNTAWKAFNIGAVEGSMHVEDGLLKITSAENDQYGAYYQAQSFDGHFYIDLEITQDQSVGLALIKEKNGEADLHNYSLLTVTTNEHGQTVVEIKDKQDGNNNVLDNTGEANRTRYQQVLTGNTYSVPFTKTAKKLRIIRHASENFLHFYYAVSKEIRGEVAENWMELAPSKEWGDFNTPYFVGLVGIDGEGQFDKVTVTQTPLNDQSDVNTGFKATWRDYNWSGYFGNALVVSFGDEFSHTKDDRKFVFWEQFNFVPSWHLNNDSHYSYEFVETWDEKTSGGCFEPMSDRLLRHSEVNLIEDNNVRKIIHWHYVLMDPDYNVPHQHQGTQLPEVDEYYTIYADGTIIREIQYMPKLDSDHRSWHELTEPMLIAGNNHWPKDLLENTALSVYTIFDDKKQTYSLRGNENFKNEDRLGPTVLVGHVKNAVDVFNAFSDDVSVPETFAGYKQDYKIDWHNRELNFSHWPINKEPYAEPHKSWADWEEQIAHTSLIGMGVYGGADWNDRYLERENGRKYRKWSMLAGLLPKNSIEIAKDLTNSWLYSGYIILEDDSSQYNGYNHDRKQFEFTCREEKASANFEISPDESLINPVFHIKNWGDQDVYINIEGKNLKASDYIYSLENGALLLLIKKEIQDRNLFKITSSPIMEENEEDDNDDHITSDDTEEIGFRFKLYPNPVSTQNFTIEINEIQNAQLRITNMSGQIVHEQPIKDEKKMVHIPHLTKGIYIVNIQSERVFVSKKLIIQ